VLRTLDDHRLEILVTLALAAGSYALAGALQVSAPLAMVVIGLLIGNQGRHLAMSATTREHLDTFWDLVDEILNAVLFLLIGLELLLLLPLPGPWSGVGLAAALLAIPVVLASRFVGIGLPVTVLRLAGRAFSPRAVRVITWAGLRGGISVALALSLPSGEERALLLLMTYVVVVFSILVQGLTLGRVIRGAAR
jgi:CPA1 family monovalent cation:H+ antiporter